MSFVVGYGAIIPNPINCPSNVTAQRHGLQTVGVPVPWGDIGITSLWDRTPQTQYLMLYQNGTWVPDTIIGKEAKPSLFAVSPLAVLSWDMQKGSAFSYQGTLADYYFNTPAWQPVLSNVFVSKIIYCAARNDRSVFANGFFLAFSRGGYLWASTDQTGTNFNEVYGVPAGAIDVAYREGIVVVITPYQVYYSTDLSAWTLIAVNRQPLYNNQGVS